MNTTHLAFLITTIALMTAASAGPQQPAGAPPPPDYSYNRLINGNPELLVEEIKRAIEASPKNAVHHFNLAVAYAVLFSPPDIQAARTAYKKALELGVQPDPKLEKILSPK